MDDDRVRIQSMLTSLVPYQQEQVRTQVAAYQSTLAAQKLPKDKIAKAVFEYWKTMVSYLYNHSQGRATLVAQAAPKRTSGNAHVPASKPLVQQHATSVKKPPPPPPSKPAHPLSVSGSVLEKRVEVSSSSMKQPQLVDKSEGLLARLTQKVVLPVGLQDWVNRVYAGADQGVSSCKPKAGEYVTDTIRLLLHTGDLLKQNWVVFPVPTQSDLRKYVAGSYAIQREKKVVIDLDREIVKAEKPVKSRRIVQADQEMIEARDFIPVSDVAVKEKNRRAPAVDKEELKKRNQRAQKFKEHLADSSGIVSPERTDVSVNVQFEFGNDEEDIFEKTEQYSVTGTCQTMEKRYLRLTSAPDPGQVRPEPVLQRWLAELETLWAHKKKEWKYVEDQMRAIRQDLTVQNIRGPFREQVYELNARWALESGDLGQFNQCQTQLKQLHSESRTASVDLKAEFLSYRLLYYFFQNLRVDEQLFLNKLTSHSDLRRHPYIEFALEIRSSATTHNFSKYFQLARISQGKSSEIKFRGAPASHVKYILHAFEARQRVFALMVLTRAFATHIALSWLSALLGFDSDNDCSSFILGNGGVMKNINSLDPKASNEEFSASPLLVSSKLKLMG